MSQISDLRNKEENQFNFIKLIERLSEQPDTKYIKMFDRLIKTRISKLVDKMSNEFFTDNEVENLFIAMLFSNIILPQEMHLLNYFCMKDKQGAVSGMDTQTASIDDILAKATSMRKKELEAEKENMVEKILDNEDWVVLLPLSYEASLKYGAHTKWCTASREDKTHYDSYTKNGILIYCINKKTNLKYGFFYDMHHSSTSFIPTSALSLWDAEDNFVEIIYSDLPLDVIKVISDYTKNNKKTNNILTKQKYNDIFMTVSSSNSVINSFGLAGLDGEIIQLTREGKSLAAVKLIKDLGNMGLKEAKDLYDTYYKPTYSNR